MEASLVGLVGGSLPFDLAALGAPRPGVGAQCVHIALCAFPE
jgi:hypothetical protein